MITATGQGTLPLTTVGEAEFEISRIGAKITFIENAQGKVDRFTFDHNGKKMEGKRIKFLVEDSVLQGYTGTYYSPELKTFYQLSLDNGVLKATHQRQKDD